MSIKQRAYPEDGHQTDLLAMHCNHARFVYNIGLEQRKSCGRSQRERGIRVTAASQSRELTEARRNIDWLAEGSTVVQQGALRDLDRAFTNFFAGRARYPRFRRKIGRQSFVVRDVRLRRYSRKWAAILVPKAGWVRFRLSVNWSEAQSATGARIIHHNNRWHVTLTVLPRDKKSSGSGVVGIDRGVAVSAMTSDGHGHRAPSLTEGEQQRYLSLERLVATQTKGSRRRRRSLGKMAAIRQRLDDRRHHWVEQTTTDLAERYESAVLEDLNIAGMVRRAAPTPDPDNEGHFLPNGASAKTGLSRVIHASVWGRFESRLDDKMKVVKINPAYTSQRCHECGHTSTDNRENQAEFRCTGCGHTDNADVNAAKNIRDIGTEQFLLDPQPGGTGCLGEAVNGDANLQPA